MGDGRHGVAVVDAVVGSGLGFFAVAAGQASVALDLAPAADDARSAGVSLLCRSRLAKSLDVGLTWLGDDASWRPSL